MADNRLADDHGHVFETCDEDPCDCGGNVCRGGLAICAVCGGAEGSLTTECCGEQLTYGMGEAVYAGGRDFRNGQWLLL